MGFRRTQNDAGQKNFSLNTEFDTDARIEASLMTILAENTAIFHKASNFKDEREEFEAQLMHHPISTSETFAYFGFLLGLFPPAAIFWRIFQYPIQNKSIGLILLLVLMNLVCTGIGYSWGKVIGKIISEAEKKSWHLMLILLPLIGMLWGVITGAAGGFIFFIFGAFFGGVFGAIVGGAAITFFGILHRILKKGDMIDRKHFLPIAFGIVFAISAFFLGL